MEFSYQCHLSWAYSYDNQTYDHMGYIHLKEKLTSNINISKICFVDYNF